VLVTSDQFNFANKQATIPQQSGMTEVFVSATNGFGSGDDSVQFICSQPSQPEPACDFRGASTSRIGSNIMCRWNSATNTDSYQVAIRRSGSSMYESVTSRCAESVGGKINNDGLA
jgi:hypothetical protein